MLRGDLFLQLSNFCFFLRLEYALRSYLSSQVYLSRCTYELCFTLKQVHIDGFLMVGLLKQAMRKLVVLLCFLASISAIPYVDQITLANSLIVGRENNDDLFNWVCKVCDHSNKPIHSHVIEEKSVDIKSIVSVYNDFVVLAFRYTNSALNVWEDILYPIQVSAEHTCKNCKIQRAYSNMWKAIKQDVFNDLRQIQLETQLRQLHITGISLGGGLASISFVDINYEEIFDFIDVTTYGAPRVGNKHWAAHFDLITLERTRRYVVEGDPVAVLPRCLTLVCTYRQTGIKITCYENEQICRQEHEIPDDDDEPDESKIWQGVKQVQEMGHHFSQDMKRSHSLRSIMDHIEGYPKIYNFTIQIE